MKWYEELAESINEKKTYSHSELIDELKGIKPDLSYNTYHWAIDGLVREGSLVKEGYSRYSWSDGTSLDEYQPDYSDYALYVIDLIEKNFPYIRFTVFETVLMNEFLNHLIGNNTIFIQVEKDSSIFVFRFLQEKGFQNLLYKPNKSDFELYWRKGCLVVTDLISETPMRKNSPHTIMLEKILVDIVADKLISTAFSKAEVPDVFEQVKNRYRLDKVRMYRYAKRRNRENEVKKYLEE